MTALAIAKNRVAPVKRITRSKLELMAVVIGTRLATQLKHNLKIKDTVIWSDSLIVLYWITSKNRYVNLSESYQQNTRIGMSLA